MIQIVPYDQVWPSWFAAEASRLRAAFGALALRIDHVGSTAVLDLPAKPIIDIQVSVASLVPQGWLLPYLTPLGYSHVDLGEFDLVYPYFRKPNSWPHTHHVHVCVAGSEQERRHLAFRDYLRMHSQVAFEYAGLKRQLARQHLGRDQGERERYSLAKSAFVEAAIAKAFSEGLPHWHGSDG